MERVARVRAEIPAATAANAIRGRVRLFNLVSSPW